jgi:hypothetical protein
LVKTDIAGCPKKLVPSFVIAGFTSRKVSKVQLPLCRTGKTVAGLDIRDR